MFIIIIIITLDKIYALYHVTYVSKKELNKILSLIGYKNKLILTKTIN